MDEENNKSNKEIHIWVDADACPVVRMVEKIAKKYTDRKSTRLNSSH